MIDWESHLRRISDFLAYGMVWWKERELGIEFFDCEPNNTIDINQYPRVKHFRSASIDDVTNDLEEHWSTIIKNRICIPTHISSLVS